MDHVTSRVNQILADLNTFHKEAKDISSSDSLQVDLGLDSLQIIECLTAIEDTFGITITDNELIEQEEWMQTAGTLIDFIRCKLDHVES